ncbi:hypothetical protein M8818_000508 [Zalaria obscura]|uniref:Uncharacterized protein n=1 Tax=Zalaria obscura TaxID=2024903 RepID=A0ACC3SNR4_9PEZI
MAARGRSRDPRSVSDRELAAFDAAVCVLSSNMGGVGQSSLPPRVRVDYAQKLGDIEPDKEGPSMLAVNMPGRLDNLLDSQIACADLRKLGFES